ncbi:type II toxin-antitoxin system RelE/ParE family toxin [Rudaea sp.]|uniref:type II toxin-antitoxin system RelE/ParE family toxin n=1 Tax=Rudaea sp. TaxID=2136325 RepID=UPI0039C95E1B
MGTRRVEFHPSAAEEIERARAWYATRNPIAAHAFVVELEQSVKRIGESPETWPKYIAETRRYSFPRFPFSLIYRLQSIAGRSDRCSRSQSSSSQARVLGFTR